MKKIQKLAFLAALFLIFTATTRFRTNTENWIQDVQPESSKYYCFTPDDFSPYDFMESRAFESVVPVQQITVVDKIRPSFCASSWERQQFWKKNKSYTYFTTIPYSIRRFESFDRIFPFHEFL